MTIAVVHAGVALLSLAVRLPLRRAPPILATAAEPSNWHVTVPRSYGDAAEQAARSTLAAARDGGRRLLVENAAIELSPGSEYYQPSELIGIVHRLALALLEAPPVGLLPASRPHIKLLFSSPADATLAGASILTPDTPVSCLGHPSALGPRDGAFIVVSPGAAAGGIDADRALADLLDAASGRLVVVVNPAAGAAARAALDTAYLMRPLSLGYLRDSYATQVSRGRAVLLRCFPHEWSVLVDADGGGRWSWAGQFNAEPNDAQIEAVCRDEVTRLRMEAGVAFPDGGDLES